MTAGKKRGKVLELGLSLGLAHINQLISSDPFTRQSLSRLAGNRGRSLLIQIAPEERRFLLRIENSRPLLRLAPESESSADVCLSGTLPAFASLLAARDKSTELMAGDIRISGDTGLLRRLGDIADAFQPDAGALLAPWTPAPFAGFVQSFLQRLGSRAEPNLQEQMLQTLTDRLQLLVAREEFESAAEDLFDLQTKVEQLSARLNRLGPQKT